MSARRALVTLSFAVALFACTGQEQTLGGEPSNPPLPRPTPTTWIGSTTGQCPFAKPAEAAPCETHDELGAPKAVQCAYAPNTSAYSLCVCGFGGRWSCFHSLTGILTADLCAEGLECSDGVGCATDDVRCRCLSEKLSCEPRRLP